MLSTEFDSWFSAMRGCTCCVVKTDEGIFYIVVFDADDGVSCSVFTGVNK